MISSERVNFALASDGNGLRTCECRVIYRIMRNMIIRQAEEIDDM
jgi:hypothetical protein